MGAGAVIEQSCPSAAIAPRAMPAPTPVAIIANESKESKMARNCCMILM